MGGPHTLRLLNVKLQGYLGNYYCYEEFCANKANDL